MITTLWHQDDESDIPRVTWEETMHNSVQGLALCAYPLTADPDDADPEAGLTDRVFLPWGAVGRLVELYALRHPQHAAALVAKAQGWRRSNPVAAAP